MLQAGPDGCLLPARYETHDTLVVQLEGARRVLLVPPEQVKVSPALAVRLWEMWLQLLGSTWLFTRCWLAHTKLTRVTCCGTPGVPGRDPVPGGAPL